MCRTPNSALSQSRSCSTSGSERLSTRVPGSPRIARTSRRPSATPTNGRLIPSEMYQDPALELRAAAAVPALVVAATASPSEQPRAFGQSTPYAQ